MLQITCAIKFQLSVLYIFNFVKAYGLYSQVAKYTQLLYSKV